MSLSSRTPSHLLLPLLLVVSGCGSCGELDDTAPSDTASPKRHPVRAGLEHADARIGGQQEEGALGTLVAPAGSALGDGRPALIITEAGLTDSTPAMAYIVPGDIRGQVSINVAVASVASEHWDDAFEAVSPWTGDADGDGVDDLLIGIPNRYDYNEGCYRGAAYILSGPLSGAYEITDAAVSLVSEETDGRAGSAVGFVGDLDGDGLDDITVSDPYYSGSHEEAGAVYILSGPVTAPGDLSLADVRIEGDSEGQHATGGTGIGDANGDGYADFLVKTDGDHLHLFHGPATTSASLTTAAARIDMYTYEVVASAAGDVDGDGADDILIGDPGAGNCHDDCDEIRDYMYETGAAYVFSGRLEGSHTFDDSSIFFESTWDYLCLGYDVTSAGDVDGDGQTDVLVGSAPYVPDTIHADGYPSRGWSWLFLGPFSESMDMYDNTDIYFAGEGGHDWAGSAVSGVGDLNGDGLSDLAIAAPLADIGATDSGAVYIVLGREDIVEHYGALEDVEAMGDR